MKNFLPDESLYKIDQIRKVYVLLVRQAVHYLFIRLFTFGIGKVYNIHNQNTLPPIC